MGYGLARLWLAAAALCTGAAVGDLHHGLTAPLALATASVATLARRRSALRALGLAGLAVALGWVSAAHRAARPSVLAELSSGAPRCALVGRVLEGAGGLGTLAAVTAAHCRDGPSLQDPGVVVFDQSLVPGATFEGEG